MSDTEKTSVNKKMEEVKQSVEQDEVKPDVKQDQVKPDGEQDEVKPVGEQGKHNEPSTSIPAVSPVSTNPIDDELRKYHEAMFQLHKARICMNMWNIYNSYH